MKNLTILLTGALLLFTGTARAANWDRIAGSDSSILAGRAVAVSQDESWAELWAEHTREMGEKPALPEVDFTKETVVAVFLGQKTSGGYSVAFDADADPKKPGELLVRFQEKKVPQGFAVTLMTSPFEFRKFDKVYAAVRFVEPRKSVSARKGQDTEAKVAASGSRFNRVDIGRLSDSLHALAPTAVFDGNSAAAAAMVETPFGIVKVGLPPPPGQEKKKKSLPPPPDEGKKLPPPAREGKKLPPPPDGGGKPLPPPPGSGGKPLPPPPRRTLPRPVYPGGPLPEDSLVLQRAEQTYATYGMTYIGYWHDGHGYEASQGVVRTAPSDSGSYILDLTSGRYQYYVEFYHNQQDDAVYYTRTKNKIGGKSRRLYVDFDNRAQKPLLPWEKESFTFSLKEDRAALESADGAYEYDVSYSFPSNDSSRVNVTMTAKGKRQTAADPQGVGAGLRVENGRLKLIVTDKWSQYYAGENLEVAYVIRWDDGSMWRRDPVIAQATTRSPVRKSVAQVIEIDIPTSKSGKHYLESWSFRRADSRISAGRWISGGQGNAVIK